MLHSIIIIRKKLQKKGAGDGALFLCADIIFAYRRKKANEIDGVVDGLSSIIVSTE